MTSLISRRVLTAWIFCVGVAGPLAVAHARADESEVWDKAKTCSDLVKTLKNTDWYRDGYAKQLEGLLAVGWVLAIDCPTDPADLPVQDLLIFQDVRKNDAASFLLGAAYEYGLRVEADPEEARYWYRRYAFGAIGLTDKDFDKVRERLALFSARKQGVSEDTLDAALAKGELKSAMFEAEIAAVWKLVDGPATDIVAVSEHLYRGTGGYHQSTSAAKRILDLAAEKGAPEAQYALAKAVLERRFYMLPMMLRSDQLYRVESYLRAAAKRRYLPAIVELAEFCETHGRVDAMEVARGLYELAVREGAQGVKERLRHLLEHWDPALDYFFKRREKEIERGDVPRCY